MAVKKKRTKGDGALFKRADGMWIGRMEVDTEDGGRRRKTVASRDRNTALVKLKKLRAQVAAGTVPEASTVKTDTWLTHWLETIRGPKLRPTTHRTYATAIRLYINPILGHKRLDQLTMADVRRMHHILQTTSTDDRKASTRSAQIAHQVLQKALKDAKKEGSVGRNVAEDEGKPEHRAVEQIAFTAKVSKLIIARGFSSGDETWGTRWATGFLTGAREAEVLGLTWDRVHLDIGRIDISWQLQELRKTHGCGTPVDGKYPCGKVRVSFCPQSYWNLRATFERKHLERNIFLTRPKTKRSQRMIPILPGLGKRLEQLRDITPNPHGLVFHHDDGTPFTQSQDQKAWRALLKSVGVEHVGQHTMRRSTATLLMEEGVDARIIAEILGHTNVVTTRGYQFVDLSVALTAMAPLDELLG
jgi:integrase